MKIERARRVSRRTAVTILFWASGCTRTIPIPRRSANPQPLSQGEGPEQILEGLVAAHNEERNSAGLAPLSESEELKAAASRHARDMAARNRMSHRGSDLSSPFQRMEQEGYRFQRAAENVAMGEFTLTSLMKAWMTSAGHRRNILGNYSEIGAAYATAEDGRSYWCVTFGTPLGA